MSLEFGRRIVDIPTSPAFAGGFDSYGNASTFGPHRIGSPDDEKLEQKWGISPYDMSNQVAKALSRAAIRERSDGLEDGSYEEPSEKSLPLILDAVLKNHVNFPTQTKEPKIYQIENRIDDRKDVTQKKYEHIIKIHNFINELPTKPLLDFNSENYLRDDEILEHRAYVRDRMIPFGGGMDIDFPFPDREQVRYKTPKVDITLPTHSVVATNGEDGQAPVVVVENEQWHF